MTKNIKLPTLEEINNLTKEYHTPEGTQKRLEKEKEFHIEKFIEYLIRLAENGQTGGTISYIQASAYEVLKEQLAEENYHFKILTTHPQLEYKPLHETYYTIAVAWGDNPKFKLEDVEEAYRKNPWFFK